MTLITPYYIKITPEGIRRAPRSAAEMMQGLSAEWSKVKLIVLAELQGRIFEKALGILFLAIEPIVMAFVYYFLTFVLLGSSLPREQFLIIFISVVFWRWMSKSVDNAPGLFSGYATVLKQTNFNVFSLVISAIGIESCYFLVALSVLLVLCVAFGYTPRLSYLLLIVPMLAQASIILFLTVLFAIGGAFVRDLQGLVSAGTGIWFYLSPGIYPIQRVPVDLLWVYYLNPFAHILPAYHSVIINGELPNLRPLLLITVIGCVLSVLALRLLGYARRHFFSFI